MYNNLTGNVSQEELANMFTLANKLTNKKGEMDLQKDIAHVREDLPTLRDSDIKKEVTENPIVFVKSGLKLHGDKLSRLDYLSALDIDEGAYEMMAMTPEEAQRFHRSIIKTTTGGILKAAPMQCRGSKCHFKETCLTGDTIVLMYDGSYKQIKDITKRDRICSFSEKEKRMTEDFANCHAQSMGVKPVFLLTTKHGHYIKCTSDHLFYAKEGNNKYCYISIDTGLRPGVKLLFTDGFYNKYLEDGLAPCKEYGDVFVTEILSIEPAGEEEVFDISVLANKNFFANGLLVHNCELYKMNKAPVGAPCPYEQAYLREQAGRYFEEFDVTPDKPTEMNLVSELAEMDMYERRVTMLLAMKDQDLSQEDIVGFSEDGSPIIKEDVSKYFNIKERIKKQRLKNLEALLATKKERAKVASQISNTTANPNRESLKDKIDMLLKARSENTSGFVDPSVQELLK